MREAAVILKRHEDLRIRRGHPWIYDNEILSVEGAPCAPGGEILALDARRKTLGYGFFNPASKIRVRLFSRSHKRADLGFFKEALAAAKAWRARFFDVDQQSLRLVFGEADSLPGLIVDQFAGSDATRGDLAGSNAVKGRWLSVQFLSLGVDTRKQDIVQALQEVFSPDGIVERSEAPVRALEGLQPACGILAGTVPDSIIIEENGARFAIDIKSGQKTGWFLDQRANRAAAARFAQGADTLDVFCNQGAFGILCALQGAHSVLALDSSAEALSALRNNAALNNVASQIETREANAFDQLRALEAEGRKFDMVILDPPAFAKSRQSLKAAQRGYKEINVRGIRILKRGGILVSCSCSHYVDDVLFDTMLAEAAFDCGRRFRLIEKRTQDLDHPIISGYEESRYLKCRIVEL